MTQPNNERQAMQHTTLPQHRPSHRPLAGTALAALAALLATACTTLSTPTTIADQVFTNGQVITVDARSTIAQAFALKDGKFLAVGSNAQAMAHAGPGTRVVDLQGRTTIPGLADSHLHTAGGGPGMDLSRTRSLGDIFAIVSQAARAAKPGQVLIGNSDWHEAQLREQRLPTATELEAAAPGVPVVLVRGGHSYFLNRTALALFGITPATPVPAGGAIPVGPDGTLTGEVTGTAKPLVKLPEQINAYSVAGLQGQQKILNSYGLTSVRVPGVSVADYRQFQALGASGQATLRYNVLLRPRNVDDFRATVVNSSLKQDEGDDWVRLGGIKVGLDGGFEGGHMTRPYDEPMGRGGKYVGLRIMLQTEVNEYMRALNQAGWRASVHVVGDAAVDQALEGFEKANADQDITAKRWTLEHAFITRPDHYPRIKRLNLNLSVQDHLYLAAPVLKRYWGMDRASQVTPVKTYLDQGFLLAGGTDSPVIPLSPFWAIYHFMTRDTISDGIYGANQAITSRDTLLRLFTINNAKLTGEDAVKGSIEPGKLADFAVLSADYLTIAPAEVAALRAVATYVGGKLVYSAEGFKP